MVAGPAARIAVAPQVTKLVAGQRLRLTATSYSQAGDERNDSFAWKSSAPGVVKVSVDGVLSAVAPGTRHDHGPHGAARRPAFRSRWWPTRSRGWR